ncbi:MAG: hypothetical protein QXZ25_06725 [Candidatus Bathyarchaeia archaeon]
MIALYIEGIDEPRRLSDMIAEASKKADHGLQGRRNEEADAVSRFHTGSLVGNYRIWKDGFDSGGLVRFSLEVMSEDENTDGSCSSICLRRQI